jgi:hypothetical protein
MAAPQKNRSQIREDDDTLEFETSQEIKLYPSFDSMGLREELTRGIYAYGFEKPSAIQQRAIVPVITGRDVIAQAQSVLERLPRFAFQFCNQSTQQSEKLKPLSYLQPENWLNKFKKLL